VDVLLNYVLPFLVILTILVFVHEMGHFWVARVNNVRVEVFSVGFGPEIFGFHDKHGTRWKFAAIPLGGYVKMFGEGETVDDEENERELTDEEKEVSFFHKRLGQRTAVVAAGPAANFIFAIFVMALLFAISGAPKPLAGIGSILTGSAAEEAGLEIGDRIFSINDEEIKWFDDLSRIVSASPGRTLMLGVARGDTELTLQATPKSRAADSESKEGEVRGILGVSPHPDLVEYETYGPLQATWKAVERTYDLSATILSYLGEMITGSRTSKELGGPLRIAHFSGEMFQGGWVNTFFFLAVLSVNLGLINLFPIPMLDGGHLVFYAAEAVLGRPIGPKAQEYSFRFGLILVLLIMIYATWNDLEFFKILDFAN